MAAHEVIVRMAAAISGARFIVNASLPKTRIIPQPEASAQGTYRDRKNLGSVSV
jgi:hypothetical protein